jgi:hypothetical protein
MLFEQVSAPRQRSPICRHSRELSPPHPRRLSRQPARLPGPPMTLVKSAADRSGRPAAVRFRWGVTSNKLRRHGIAVPTLDGELALLRQGFVRSDDEPRLQTKPLDCERLEEMETRLGALLETKLIRAAALHLGKRGGLAHRGLRMVLPRECGSRSAAVLLAKWAGTGLTGRTHGCTEADTSKDGSKHAFLTAFLWQEEPTWRVNVESFYRKAVF